MINSLKKNFYENLSLFYAVYFIIFILFLTTIAPIITTSSAATYWSDYQEKSFASGSGTSSDPYIITTPGQLYYFFSSNKNAYGKLGTTLDLSAHMWDSPEISTEKINLDGDGKSILNLQSNSIYCGLIGKNTNSNSEITFNNLTIKLKYSGSSSSQYGGGLVGYTDGTVNLNKCVADGTITASFSNFIGGFIGRANYLNATQCLNYVSMYVTDGNVGGICGYVNISATLKLCGNNGDLTTNKTYAGGLIANCGSLTVNECFNYGIITANNGYVGGLFGSVTSSSDYTLTDVYNSGIITGNYAGGLIAFSNKKVTLNNAYNSGDVVSQQNITPTKYVDNGTHNIGMNFTGFGEMSIPQSSNVNKNESIAETYDTGGTAEYYIQPYISNIVYDKYAADVSLLNQKDKIAKKTNTYSIEPSCLENNFSKTITFSLNVDITLEGVSGSTKKVYKDCQFEVPVLTMDILACNSVIHPPNSQFQGQIDIECDGYQLSDCKTPDGIWLTQYLFDKYIFSGNSNNRVASVKNIYFVGVRVGVYGNNVYRVVPLMLFRLQMYDDYNNRVWWADYVSIVDYDYCDITYNTVKEKYYTADYIKTVNFGDNFAVNENINGGMPYLKNFYWQ